MVGAPSTTLIHNAPLHFQRQFLENSFRMTKANRWLIALIALLIMPWDMKVTKMMRGFITAAVRGWCGQFWGDIEEGSLMESWNLTVWGNNLPLVQFIIASHTLCRADKIALIYRPRTVLKFRGGEITCPVFIHPLTYNLILHSNNFLKFTFVTVVLLRLFFKTSPLWIRIYLECSKLFLTDMTLWHILVNESQHTVLF